MKFDDLLIHLGEFGSYQKRQYLLVCLPKIFTGFQMVISVFIAGVPFHRGLIPGWENDTYAIQSERHQLYINASIPIVVESTGSSYSQCDRYVREGGEPLVESNGSVLDLNTRECEQWVYDQSIFQTTIVTQMDLVCDKKSYRSRAQMAFMGGVLVGSVVFGILADVLGRKTCIHIALTLQTTSGLAAAFALEYYSFCVLRLMNGTSNAGLMINSVFTEILGPSKRRWASILIMYFFTFGYIMLAGLAYLIRNWQYLEIACSAPGAGFLTYWFILPESPRWLIAKGKKEKAKNILMKIAKANKVPLNEKMLDDVTLENVKQTERMVVSMMYYGLSLKSGNLNGDIHINFLSGLVEIPAYSCLVWALNRLGRRSLHSSMMTVAQQWITITLAMIGKFSATAAFSTVYVVTSEIFPTVIRNAAMGGRSMCARIGGMVAPYIADLGDYVGGEMGQAVPLVTFGVSAIVAGCLSLFLLETFNRKLPETIEDGINFAR
ncbi:organic cation transporter protein-like [Liolophura sinensis]|uniref:organic cation transporter protein-like n=1 Tax=Liolophura sinensis TaxID=3198878 RepID=UPI003157FB18